MIADASEFPDPVRRPDKDHYFLLIALAARTRADCLGRRVGAVICGEPVAADTLPNGKPTVIEAVEARIQ